MVEEVYMYI